MVLNENEYRVREIPEEGEKAYDERNEVTRIYRGKEEWRVSDLHITESQKRMKERDIWAVRGISDIQTGDELHVEDARALKTDEAIISGRDEEGGVSSMEKKLYRSTKGGYILLITWSQGSKDSGKWVYLDEEDIEKLIRDMVEDDMEIDAEDELEEDFSYELSTAAT